MFIAKRMYLRRVFPAWSIYLVFLGPWRSKLRKPPFALPLSGVVSPCMWEKQSRPGLKRGGKINKGEAKCCNWILMISPGSGENVNSPKKERRQGS